jgi:hypothetical protein
VAVLEVSRSIEKKPPSQPCWVMAWSGVMEVADPVRRGGTAHLAAELCVTIFAVAFEQWIADGETRSPAEVGRDILREFRILALETAEP